MLKINLIPEEKRKTNKEFFYLKIYGIVYIICIIAIISSAIYLNKKEKYYLNKIDILQENLQKENLLVSKLKELKEKEKNLSYRLEAIISLQKNRTKILKYFEKAIQNFPENRMYLTDLRIKINSMQMEGFTIDLETIAQYMKDLEEKNTFRKIILEKTAQKKIKGFELINFKLKLEY